MKFLQLLLLFLSSNISIAYSIDFLPVPSTNIIKHTYYTLSFNEAYEQANWVYYALTDSMVLNSGEERSNSFKMDKKVITYSAKSSDYTKSGYDRGHLCPAADMGFNTIAMEESFLMSNISPQKPEFNRGIWKELETKVREWAKLEHKLYVVTGPVFKDNKGYIGKEKVLVPGYFFKVIYDPTDQPKVIAFVFPNQESNRPLTDFAVTPDKAEELTGFDLFSQLPDDQEKKLESSVQLTGWFEGYVPEKPTPEVRAEKVPDAKPKAPQPTITKEKEKVDKQEAPVNINLVLIILFILFIVLIIILIVTFNSSKRS